MKIQKLIQKLENLKSKKGNIDVLISNNKDDTLIDILLNLTEYSETLEDYKPVIEIKAL